MPDSIDASQLTLSSAIVAGLVTTLALGLSMFRVAPPIARRVIPSPRTTLLPSLTPAQTASLGYPPNALPGARDVTTPYGCMRIYEWGPTDGRKVVLVHGDATPAPMFGRIADQLVAKGCRVMCFDLWGRGYTDTPVGVQHDSRLYAQQIMFAIASSPTQWTGTKNGGESNKFSLVGFSMGGSISLDFLAHQPHMVESVVLLGPGGLIRTLPSEYTSTWFWYPTLVSKNYMRRLIGTLLGVSLLRKPVAERSSSDEKVPEGFTPAGALQFQFDHHQGHVDSFLSTIQYGPLQHQEAVWEKACGIIAGTTPVRTLGDSKPPLYGGKILVVCGKDDSVVPPQDVEDDLKAYLGGPEHYVFKTVPGGHGFPWPEGTTIGKYIVEFWEL